MFQQVNKLNPPALSPCAQVQRGRAKTLGASNITAAQLEAVLAWKMSENPWENIGKWEFQDPKLEVLYYMFGHILRVYPLT